MKLWKKRPRHMRRWCTRVDVHPVIDLTDGTWTLYNLVGDWFPTRRIIGSVVRPDSYDVLTGEYNARHRKVEA